MPAKAAQKAKTVNNMKKQQKWERKKEVRTGVTDCIILIYR